MADDYQRTDYPKTGSTIGNVKGKSMSMGSMEMISGGSSGGGAGSGGPTGSSRSYPKGSWTPNAGFNPMDDKQRGATDWAVGGVGT